MINETRQREVARVTSKYIGAWNTTPEKPQAIFDGFSSQLASTEIPSCLINHQSPSFDNDLNGSCSIFSKEFTSKNYEFASQSFEETKFQK